MDDKESSLVAYIENEQRKDVSVIEKARTASRILKANNMTQDELATSLGISQSTLANRLRLLDLPLEIQESLMRNEISERHARSLLSVKDVEKQIELLNEIKEKKMTVRELESEIKQMDGNINQFTNNSLGDYADNNNTNFNNNTPIQTVENNFNLPPIDKQEDIPLANNSSTLEYLNNNTMEYLNKQEDDPNAGGDAGGSSNFMEYLNSFSNNTADNKSTDSESNNSFYNNNQTTNNLSSFLNNYESSSVNTNSNDSNNYNTSINEGLNSNANSSENHNNDSFSSFLSNYEMPSSAVNINSSEPNNTNNGLLINNTIPPITSNFNTNSYVENNPNFVDVSKKEEISSIDEIIEELKTTINGIKAKSKFKVDTDEINFDDLYQITIKIDKRDF